MRKTLSLFLALMFSVVLTVPVFADIQYADTGGNYTVVTDATLNGGLQREVYGNVAAVWENLYYDPATGQTNMDGTGVSQPYHIMKADSSGYHSVSDWYQEIGGFCKSGFAAAQNFDGKWGVLNAEGQVVVDFKFDEMNNPTDDGYVLATTKSDYSTVVLNLKTGQEVFRNSHEQLGKYPDETFTVTRIKPLDGYNNGLMPVLIEESTYISDSSTNSAHTDMEHSDSYVQYFGFDGKPAFPNKFGNKNTAMTGVTSGFHNGYAIGTEVVIDPNKSFGDKGQLNRYYSVIDTQGNVLLTDHGDFRTENWNDEVRLGWHEGDFVLASFYGYSIVSEEGIIAAFYPNGKGSGKTKYIDLSGNLIPALEKFGGWAFCNGYAATGSVLIDVSGTKFCSLKNSDSAFSDVSNTGFCWAFQESYYGKDDIQTSKDRILGVIQVPVKASNAPVSSAPAAQTAFSDVPADAYYADAVKWAVDKGVTNGVSATNFAPADTCTRGQVAAFLWRAKGCPEPATTDNPFTDVDPSSAFYKAILWAAENGVTSGTSDATFSPGNPCTRAHVVTFLWRSQGKPDASGAAPLADSFPQGYYTDAVRWADAAGLLSGTGEAFAPSALCPRADIVTYLYRVLT